MGRKRHILSEVDEEARTAICAACGPVKIRRNGGSGRKRIEGWRCSPGNPGGNRHRKRLYAVHKGNECERCGFVPQHACQLDVHHRDGDHENNAPANLETLCANCHRYEHRDAVLRSVPKVREGSALRLPFVA